VVGTVEGRLRVGDWRGAGSRCAGEATARPDERTAPRGLPTVFASGAARYGSVDIQSLVNTLAPLLGVVIGAILARGSSRRTFIQSQTVTELTHRRKVYADYQRALWAYGSRVIVALNMLDELKQKQAQAPAGVRIGGVKFDIGTLVNRQEACRDTFADIQMFASGHVQVAARAAYESLGAAFDAATTGDLAQARQHYAEYENHFTRFAEGVNVEVNVINTILYAHVTPLWRALYSQLRHKPVPFEPAPTLAPLSAFSTVEETDERT